MSIASGDDLARLLALIAVSMTTFACGGQEPTATDETGTWQADTEGDGDGDNGDGDGDGGDGDGDNGDGDGDGDNGDGDGDGDNGDGDNGDGDGDNDGDNGDGDGDGDNGDGDGDADGDTGDGDGDTGDGDGDGDSCGDGNIDLGEVCDDGNGENGDGCDNDCTASGALLWQQTIAAFDADDSAKGVAIDSSDQIFVSGYSRWGIYEADAWYSKYSPDGELSWSQGFDGEGETSFDYCSKIAVDPDENIVIACTIANGSNGDALLGKYDQDGNTIWTRQFDSGNDTAVGIAAGSDGTIAVSGGLGQLGFLRLYDEDGALVWERTFNFGVGTTGGDLSHTANGNIAVAIVPWRKARLYAPDGALISTYQEAPGRSRGIGNVGNDVLLTGYIDFPPTTAWFARLDTEGNPVWEQTWAGNDYSTAEDVALDSADRIVVVGTRRVADQGSLVVTRKYTPDGQTLIWEQTLEGSKLDGGNEPASVAIDSQDNVIVCGWLEEEADRDAFVAKYAP